ncbi:hypothetical protein [Nostoc sp. GT001]|uniref:hypothetical protein n=1 Tax=Nostoc sp. GT001 TaxID=3056647 RepID=UPI0025AA9E7A|nr:hypothetical protein [Nostoc sp. GT001]MDM9583079.1 hypothetical protein [Nostoc sp. GT001]
MIFLICNNEIAGITDVYLESELPTGYKCIEGPNLLPYEVYWDGEAVLPKPPQPSLEHYWDSTTNTWQLPQLITIPQIKVENWDKLILLLDSSPEWGRVYAAAEKTLKANTAFTTLLTTLTNLRKVETLIFAIAKLREAMTGISGVGDFTSEEIASINQKLTDCGFELQLS